jgi:hypothetical protein
MTSSFHTHILLFFACTSFFFSFFVLLTRIEIHFNTFQTKRTLLIYDHYQSPATFLSIGNRTKYIQTFTNEQIDDISLRQKVLGANTTKNSIFNRFIFNNPSKPICNNFKDPNKSIILIVLSRALNLDYRQAIRATWGRSITYKSTNITVKTIFFVGTDDSIYSAIRAEQAIFNDIVEISK